MYEVKTIENYGLTIRILLLFISIVALFYKSKNVKLDNYSIKPKDIIVIFYGLYFILLMNLIFGIKRGNFTSYTVSITPIYEYSVMLFLFAYLSSGKSKIRKSLLLLLGAVFILQDFYYGGRITSLQLILLFLVTMFVKKLSVKLILVGGLAGILINSLVGAYRQEYLLQSISFIGVFNNLKDNLFVFDTPVFAYYASATHVAATPLLSLNEKLTSFFTFLCSIFVGENFEIGDVTKYVSDNYFYNYGGGLIPTHFYFWFGLLGVICIAVLVVFIFNRIGKGKSDYWKSASIVLIYSTPRWYLYTPLSLFRPLFLLLILYLLFTMTHHILFKIAGKKVVINDVEHSSHMVGK